MNGTAILVDASNLLHRAYHASVASAERDARQYGVDAKPLQASDGFPTGALLGWFRTLLKLRDEYNPDVIVAVFDHGRPQARLDILPDYKGTRSKRDESLSVQMHDAYENTHLFGIAIARQENTEADDIIGSLAKQWTGDRVIIVGDDKDLGQCVNDRVHQLKSPRVKGQSWHICTPKEIEESFGVKPEQIPDYLALTGDSSDNIPGMPGVGKVTAVKWLTEHGNIDGVIANAESLMPKKFPAIIKEESEKLRGYLGITRLHEIAIDFPSVVDTTKDQLVAYLDQRELHSISAKIFGHAKRETPQHLAGPSQGSPTPKVADSPTQGMLF